MSTIVNRKINSGEFCIIDEIQNLYFYGDTSMPTIELLYELRSNKTCRNIISNVKDTFKKFYRTYHIFGGKEYRCQDISRYLCYFLDGKSPKDDTKKILINLFVKICSSIDFIRVDNIYKPFNMNLSRCYLTLFR
jgi:hypothetical protein